MLGETVDELERTADALTPDRLSKRVLEAHHDA
jgi:hypothetical protein